MTRKEKRIRIDLALKEITIPFIRQQGFTGTMPHFRRKNKDRINLLTFQHSLYDCRFVVEIANCPIDGFIRPTGEKVEPLNVNVHDMGKRLRIGSIKHKMDYWFDYGKFSLFGNTYKKRAKEVTDLWSEAEDWWNNDPYDQRLSNISK